jgi:8-oxo-dGTP diphosphatase
MSSVKRLSEFPRPSVAVDIAVLTVAPAQATLADVGELSVLVLRPDHELRGVLPGRFIRERQTIAETVKEVLETKARLDPGDAVPRLLRVFDDPDRDERGWTLSIAHALALPADRLWASAADIVPVDRSGDLVTGEQLGYDHNEIVREAVTVMRDRYETAPDPYDLVEEPFTLSELRRVHEAVLGARLRKDTFNRRMADHLDEARDEAGRTSVRQSVGRPARLYVKRPDRSYTDTRWRLPRADGSS